MITGYHYPNYKKGADRFILKAQLAKIGQPVTSADRVEQLIFFCTSSGAVG